MSKGKGGTHKQDQTHVNIPLATTMVLACVRRTNANVYTVYAEGRKKEKRKRENKRKY